MKRGERGQEAGPSSKQQSTGGVEWGQVRVQQGAAEQRTGFLGWGEWGQEARPSSKQQSTGGVEWGQRRVQQGAAEKGTGVLGWGDRGMRLNSAVCSRAENAFNGDRAECIKAKQTGGQAPLSANARGRTKVLLSSVCGSRATTEGT